MISARSTRWSLALTLALAVSCGDDSDGAADTTPAAIASAEAAPEPVADVGPAAPVWAPGLVVTEPGQKPVPLATTPQLGALRPLAITVQASATKKKRARRWPTIRLSAVASLASASTEASRRTIVLQALDASPSKAFDEAMITGLRGQLPVGLTSIELSTDQLAATTSLAWPAATDANAIEIGHAVAHAMSHLTLPMPADPIGKKGKLEIRRIVDLMGVKTQQTLLLSLDKVAGNQLEFSGDVTYALASNAGESASALGLAELTDVNGSGKFFIRLHAPSATPIEMNLVAAVAFESGEDSQQVWLDLRVDEDYIASADRRVRWRGEFVQGGIVIGRVPPKTRVWFRRKKIRVSKEGDFVIGFGRNAGRRALVGFQFPGAAPERHVLQVQPRDFEDERIDGLPQSLIDLDKETKKALAASRKLVSKARGKVTREPYFAAGFSWPLKGRITSTYGRTRYLNGKNKGPHWGVDLAVPVGKPVRAPAGGVVVLAERKVPLSGNLMILDHGHGLTSSFLHLHRLRAKVGDVVAAGQVIATAGNSGRSTGPHLDWRMNLRDTRVDPQTIVGKREAAPAEPAE